MGYSVAMAERNVPAATASAKGILDILREKGILSEQEYKQAVDEAQEQEKKAIQKARKRGKANYRIAQQNLALGDIRFRYEGISIPSSPMCWITRIATGYVFGLDRRGN